MSGKRKARAPRPRSAPGRVPVATGSPVATGKVGPLPTEGDDAGPALAAAGKAERPKARSRADMIAAVTPVSGPGAPPVGEAPPAPPWPAAPMAAEDDLAIPPPRPSKPSDARRDASETAPPAHKASGASADAPAGRALPDFDRLAHNMGLFIEASGKAAAAYLKPRETGPATNTLGEDVKDVLTAFGHVATYWLADPARTLQAQTGLASRFVDLWADTLRRFSGAEASAAQPTGPVDKRFAAPEWHDIPAFDFLRQSYLLTSDWANTLVDEAEALDDETRERAKFYLRQVSSAVSPSNFLITNPELLRETLDQSGDNLVRGMRMLAEDVQAGKGELKIRQSDSTAFKLGVNMATTPGKVVFRNDLMELIQYAPATPDVFRRPLLIVPPWINKFYVLDLNPEKSFVRWAVAQGLTVFVVSWVNPDERHAAKDFDAYMREGILTALEAIEASVGETRVSAIGYCVGGTLLAMTLAYMAARGDARIDSATFFTAQTDFRDAGDLKVFAGEDQIAALEAQMKETGYLNGAKMANAFNMLRPNELIWSYVVDNYLKGKTPKAFDLLTWNADSTRMPAANHAFYLRNFYLGNKLTKGELDVGGERLDLGRVTIPVYNLATRDDHIAPARSVFTGAKCFGGPMRYVLAGSGHIAGVVNPPARVKYQYWAGPPVAGTFEDWLAAATEHKGSWWPDWLAWLTAQAPEKVSPRVPGEGRLRALCDAPGEYVRVQS